MIMLYLTVAYMKILFFGDLYLKWHRSSYTFDKYENWKQWHKSRSTIKEQLYITKCSSMIANEWFLMASFLKKVCSALL